MVMNVAIAPLDNKLVRQAISYAIPYQALLDQVMYGFASPAGTLIPSTMETYAGDKLDLYTTDLTKAKSLLDQSGVGPFKIELAVPQSSKQQQQAAVLIQDNLRQIGIDAQITQLPDADYQDRRNKHELPLFFHEWYSWGDDPFYQMNFLLKCGQFTNFSGYCNPALDKIIEEGTFTTDPARRQELSTEAQKIMLEDAPQAWLWAADWTVAARTNISGITKDFTEVPRFETLKKSG